MKRVITAAATVGVTVVAAGGLLTGLATTSAWASGSVPPWETGGTVSSGQPDTHEVGGLVFYDASGAQITGGSTTAPIAAYVQGTAADRTGDSSASLYGYLPKIGVAPGGWTGEQVAGPTAYPDVHAPTTISQTLPLVEPGAHDENIATLASDLPNTDPSTTDGYAGLYELRVFTTGTSSQSTTYDSADIQVSGSTWSVVYPTPTLAGTQTALTTTQTSPQVSGSSVQLNATISPAAPGTVQFENGSTAIGSPVTVSGGTASITTTTLPVGTLTLHAVYTPATFSAYSGSTGTDSFTVSPAPAAGTTLAIGINPATAAAFTSVALTGTVTKTSDSSALPSSSGTVKFFDNGSTSPFGQASVGAGGVATLNYSNFDDTAADNGLHNITAQFVPSDSTVYSPSLTPSSVLFTATAPATAPASQTVDVAIPAGTITITSPYSSGNPFDLKTAVLQPAGDKFVASAQFGDSTKSDPAQNQGVTITDTRAGDQPWTASATATNFTDGKTVPDTINAENLSFTNVTAAYITGNALVYPDVTLKNITSAAQTGAPYGTGDNGTDGLAGTGHTFASAAAGDGEVNVDGLLTLDAPTSTPAGQYTATLTFTIA